MPQPHSSILAQVYLILLIILGGEQTISFFMQRCLPDHLSKHQECLILLLYCYSLNKTGLPASCQKPYQIPSEPAKTRISNLMLRRRLLHIHNCSMNSSENFNQDKLSNHVYTQTDHQQSQRARQPQG